MVNIKNKSKIQKYEQVKTQSQPAVGYLRSRMGEHSVKFLRQNKPQIQFIKVELSLLESAELFWLYST